MSVVEAYNPDTRWGRPFGVFDPVNYSPPDYKHRGQDIRQQNAAGTASVVAEVVSLSAGRISHQYTARSTGREIVVDTGRKVGRYEIHCHNAYFSVVGTKVAAGQAFSRNATADEQPGTGWGGPHDHLVISDSPDAAHVPSRAVYDPRPFIRNALASAASDSSKPFDPTPTVPVVPIVKRSKTMQIMRIEDGGGIRYALVGENTFTLSPVYAKTETEFKVPNQWAAVWGDHRKVDGDAWTAELTRVNRARSSLGLTPLPVA